MSCIQPRIRSRAPSCSRQVQQAVPGWLGGQVRGDGGRTNATPHGPQVAGMRYLHGVLGPIIDRVFEEKKYVELDPSRVEVKDVG